jgi:hypothetical protein
VLLRGHGHGVGAHDLQDVRLLAEPLEGAGREESVRAGHPDRPGLRLPEPVEKFQDGAALGDLVVQDDHIPSGDLADHRVDADPVVGIPLFGAGRHLGAEHPGERGGLLGVAEVR